MDADEFYDWMVYFMLKDDKFKKRIEKSMVQTLTPEETSRAIKAMFASIVGA